MYKCCSLLASLFIFFPLHAQVIKYWDGHPIHLVLKPLSESLIRLPAQAEVKLPASLKNKVLLINNQQALLVKPWMIFEEALLEVKLLSPRQEVMLLGLSATPEGEEADYQIRLLPEAEPATLSLSNLELAQCLFDLARGKEKCFTDSEYKIERQPMQILKRIALYPDPFIATMPLGTWKYNNLYATLVLLKNQSSQNLRLEPMVFNGTWVEIFEERGVLNHAVTLTPQFSKQDSVLLVLLSKQPVSEVLGL